MKKTLCVTAIFLVAACVPREEGRTWHRETPIEEKVAYFKPKCVAYGYAEGSADMSRCIQKEIGDSKAAADVVSAEAADDVQEAFNKFGETSRRRRTTCTSFGRTVQCY